MYGYKGSFTYRDVENLVVPERKRWVRALEDQMKKEEAASKGEEYGDNLLRRPEKGEKAHGATELEKMSYGTAKRMQARDTKVQEAAPPYKNPSVSVIKFRSGKSKITPL